ncbi:hypothetical protein NBE98_11605 [Clostridium swellfunianum]|uniref:hypothetical protein n=1 Tax=Clostridium swellfunianum TaxID=1367462 RepID=UPI0020308661|nr:hypothetical protein [Clostridium swellfunianum]MCM0649019.1 hypothetical protein [Clostridium swellfunianum]
MNSLSMVLRKSGHDIFQNIVEVVGVSLVSSLILLPGLFFMPPAFGVIYLLFTAMPSVASAFYMINQKKNRKTFKYSMFFKGFKKFYGRALIFGILLALLTIIPVSSWWYYITAKTMLSLIIAIFQSYFYIMILIAFVYIMPIMVIEDKGMSYSLRISLKLLLDNPGYTIGSFIQVVTVSALLMVTVISIPLLFIGIFSIFSANLYENVLKKYEEIKQ